MHIVNLYICYYQKKGKEKEKDMTEKREREERERLQRDTRVNIDAILDRCSNVPGPGC